MTDGGSRGRRGGGETVLLVSPEPDTRSVASFMLARLGYRVVEARTAVEAERLYEEVGGVDLLLTEALMSRINGHVLAQSMRSRHPGLRVLFLSDATYERMARRVAMQKGIRFLVYPFTIGQLAARVREALDSPGSRMHAHS